MPIYLQAADRYRKSKSELSVSEETYVNVFAPVLIEYVTWVLKSATRDGIQRLYFLSRDGYQMYVAAKYIARSMGIDIDCRYLNVSRYALRVPEYHLIQEGCLDRICLGGIDVTFEKVMKRGGLDDKEAEEVAGLCGYADRLKQVLSYKQVIGLKEVLYKQGKFLEYVYRHSREAYHSAIGYLTQQGLLETVPYAIVDSGWTGTLQQTLNNLIASKGERRQLTGYYFGLYGTPKGSADTYKAYFFMPRDGIRRKVHFSNCLFEAVYTSTEGMTLSYGKEAEGYAPVFDSIKNPNEAHIQENINILKKYLDIYADDICAENGGFDRQENKQGLKVVSLLLKQMMGKPSKEEVLAYGNSLFSDDVLEGQLQKVAAELSDEDIHNQRFLNKALIMMGLKKGIIHESAWLEGSIVRNGRSVESNLRHARLYKYFVYIRKLIR